FVDTFFAALVIAIGWICLPPKNLSRLRYLLDIVLVVSIAIMFLEYGTKSHLVPDVRPNIGGFRSHAFFGDPLAASYLLGVYSIANFASMAIEFTRAGLIRLALGLTSLFAIMTTGGRTAAIVAILVLLAFFAFSAMRQILSGRINRAAFFYGFLALPVLVTCTIVLLQFGLFDTMLGRFEYDM